MNLTNEKTPTAATVSDFEEKSFEQDSLTIVPQDEKDFFAGFDEWCSKPPIFEWGVRTA